MKMILALFMIGGAGICALDVEAATAQEATEAVLTLTVENIKTPQGFISAGLYQGQEGYDTGRRLTGEIIAVEGDRVTLTFDSVPVGEYGIKLTHDVDGNGKMNTGLFGIPTEPYAFSNSARGSRGPAKWEKAEFEVLAGENSHIISFKK